MRRIRLYFPIRNMEAQVQTLKNWMNKIKKGYHQTVNLYGTELEVYVRRTGENAIANIAHDLP